jgi:hypothetical protein
MKALFKVMVLPMLLTGSLNADPIPLVRAAELVTKFMGSEKIEDMRLVDLFSISALRRIQLPEDAEPTSVAWRADLEETKLERTDPAMQVAIVKDGRRHRRVLEVLQNQSVIIGTVSAEPRPRVVLPAK